MRRLVLLGLIALAALLALRHRRARSPAPLAPVAPAPELPAAGAPDLPPEPPARAEEPPAPHFLSVPWTALDAPADATELSIRPELPPGTVLDRVDVQETPTQVFVTVIARPRAPEDGDPPEQTTVALNGPLEERELVHSPTDPH